MFFEVLNRETNQGDIGYAESTDGKDPNKMFRELHAQQDLQIEFLRLAGRLLG